MDRCSRLRAHLVAMSAAVTLPRRLVSESVREVFVWLMPERPGWATSTKRSGWTESQVINPSGMGGTATSSTFSQNCGATRARRSERRPPQARDTSATPETGQQLNGRGQSHHDGECSRWSQRAQLILVASSGRRVASIASLLLSMVLVAISPLSEGGENHFCPKSDSTSSTSRHRATPIA